MRRQRDAAFTDEIITNIKQFQTDTDCDKPDERTVSHAKEKTVNPIVTGQKNVGQLGNNRACGGRMSVEQPKKTPGFLCETGSGCGGLLSPHQILLTKRECHDTV